MGIIVDEITLRDFERILFDNEQVIIHDAAMNRVEKSYEFLLRFSADKLIYGINTGFGPMAQYRIDDEMRLQLQYNFIRSHATGAGNVLPPLYAKATLLTRLITLLRGVSGVHPETVERLADFINQDITPQIFEHGSVGASGDLVQLNHISLNLIGEGDVFFRGEKMAAQQALALAGIAPLQMHLREALALANGTSCMTGIGIVNLHYAQKLLYWAVVLSVWINEITHSFSDHFSAELQKAKRHEGQQKIAALMRSIAEGSHRCRDRSQLFYKQKVTEKVLEIKVQEYYSLRCVPQVLGPVYDTIRFCEKILIDELNSASDNPIIDVENENVLHGGNFHGDYISIEMDKLKIAITKLTMLMERQSNYLCHHRINDILPPFVNMGTLGFNYGMQAAHFTATSTTAESQMLSNPMSVHSIPCNNDNQDIVSMGTNSALIARAVVENAFQVIAIHCMILAQATDCLKIQEQLSPVTTKMYHDIRAIFPCFIEDHPLYIEMGKITAALKEKPTPDWM